MMPLVTVEDDLASVPIAPFCVPPVAAAQLPMNCDVMDVVGPDTVGMDVVAPINSAVINHAAVDAIAGVYAGASLDAHSIGECAPTSEGIVDLLRGNINKWQAASC